MQDIRELHNLISFKKIDVVFSMFSLVHSILYILQCFALTAFESIWKRKSSTKRPMQCSSAVNNILIPCLQTFGQTKSRSVMNSQTK